MMNMTKLQTVRKKANQPAPDAAPSIQDFSEIGQLANVDIDTLKPYVSNARVHSDRQVDLIARSIQAFGFVTPVLIDTDGNIIAGHGRVTAAKLLGITRVPALRIEHLNPEQVRAYRLVDNRHAELASWSEEMVAIELQALSDMELDFNLETIGWSTTEMDVMFDKLGDSDGADADENPAAVVDDTAPAVSRRGDVWVCGRHRVLCGSSLDADAIANVLSGRVIDMVMEDPPYNCKVSSISGSGKIKHREFVQGSGEMSDAEFQIFLRDHLDVVMRKSKQGAILMAFIDWKGIEKVIVSGKSIGLEVINVAIWNKSNAGMGDPWRSKHEMCVIFKKPGAAVTNNVELGKHGRYRTNVWDAPSKSSFGAGRLEELSMHPTVKPVSLIADAILDVTKRGEIVFDGFLGSGTTLIACERKGRVFRGMDLDPLYVDVAIKRWQRETGNSAVLEATGNSFDVVALKRAAEQPVQERQTQVSIRQRSRPTTEIA